MPPRATAPRSCPRPPRPDPRRDLEVLWPLQPEPGMAITTQLWTPRSTTDLLCDPEHVTPPLWSLLFLLGSDSSGGRVFPLLPVTPRPALMSRDKALLPRDSYPASAMFPWTNNCHRVNPHRLHCAGGPAMVISHPQAAP